MQNIISRRPRSCSPDTQPSQGRELSRFPSWMSNAGDPFGRDILSPTLHTPSLKRSSAISKTNSRCQTSSDAAARVMDAESHTAQRRLRGKTRAIPPSESTVVPDVPKPFGLVSSEEAALSALALFPASLRRVPRVRASTRASRPRPVTFAGGQLPLPCHSTPGGAQLDRQSSFIGLRELEIPMTPFDPFGDAEVEQVRRSADANEGRNADRVRDENGNGNRNGNGDRDEDGDGNGAELPEQEFVGPPVEPLAPVKLKGVQSSGSAPPRPPRKRPVDTVLLTALRTPPFLYSLVDFRQRPLPDGRSQHSPRSQRSSTHVESEPQSRWLTPSSGSEYSQIFSSPSETAEVHAVDEDEASEAQDGLAPIPRHDSPVQEAPPVSLPIYHTVIERDRVAREPEHSNGIREFVMDKLRRLARLKSKSI